MYQRSITAISLAVAALVMVACHKENYPGTLPKEKITKIYETSVFTSEMKIPGTTEWKTITKTNERHLAHEFTWEDNRIESFEDHNLGRFYSFNYDEKGRIVRIICDSDTDYSRTLSYDDHGQLARSEGSIRQSDGTLLSTQTLVYTWENGLLKSIEEDTWDHYPGEEEITSKATHSYTWENGNVISTKRRIVKSNGEVSETEYNYQYSTDINPLHGFVYLLDPYRGLIFDYEGVDCLSKNLPSRITSPTNNRQEFSYTGSPITSVEKHIIGDSSAILNVTVDSTLDFEYSR